MNILVVFSLALLISPPLSGKTRTQHRWDAKQYAQNSSPQFKNAIKEIYLLDLKGDESVLDIGCGTGKLADFILKKYLPTGTVNGIDASAEQVLLAQQLYAPNPNLSFEQANILTYEPSRQYDAAVSFWVLHWVKDYEQVLRTIFNALKPGGKALIGHLAEHDLTFIKEAKKLMKQEQWKQYCEKYEFPIYSLSLEKITQAARSVGFNIDYLQLTKNSDNAAHFKNANEYQHFYQAVPMASCIPQDQQEAFFRQVTAQALPHEINNPDESITSIGYAVYMVLEKP